MIRSGMGCMKSISNKVWVKVNHQVWDQISRVWSAIPRGQLYGQVWDQVKVQVEDQVEDQVWGRVDDQVWNRVWGRNLDQLWG